MVMDYTKQIEFLFLIISLFPFLYAETHYRFKYFISYLKKNEPEIICDIPSRLQAGSTIPLLIIIKDADKYPVDIKAITVFENANEIFSIQINKTVRSPYEDLCYPIDTSDMSCGQHFFDIRIDYSIEGKSKKCFADNHRGTSHKSLPIYISSDPLPRFKNCYYGETHAHTNYTSDQVEFGASLEAIKTMAKAMQLDFFCATDHSYDLDDYKENYLINDPNLTKWKEFQEEIKKCNQKNNDILMIPGEEVTVRNKEGKNVHLLIYNSKTFFPGTGDSGERWFNNRSELTISQVITKIPKSALSIAAHPSETPPMLQKLLINRGSWQSDDCAETGLHGLQFINGGETKFHTDGKSLWVEQLLANNRLTGLAGNDAHGNFARFRQIGFPFFTMRENYYHLFGIWRTGLYVNDQQFNLQSALNALISGNCFMTNGPALFFQLYDKNTRFSMGDDCVNPIGCEIRIQSSEEYGDINHLSVILGNLESRSEIIFYREEIQNNNRNYNKGITLTNYPKAGYFRIEVNTDKNCQALSNPIWFRRRD
jgi:hypothetical protein